MKFSVLSLVETSPLARACAPRSLHTDGAIASEVKRCEREDAMSSNYIVKCPSHPD